MKPVSIYRYPTRITAVFITGKERTHNMPIQNSKIKVYKGANEPLDFTIFDADGKPLTYDGTGKHLELKVFNKHTNKLVMTKRLVKVATTQPQSGALVPSVRKNNHIRSTYRATIEAVDTKTLEPGTHYRWVVQENDVHYNSSYFYSGLGHEVEGEMHISNEASPTVEPSVEVTTFTADRHYGRMDPYIVGDETNVNKLGWTRYISSAIPGDVMLNLPDGLHTLALYPENFTGIVQIQATLDINVPDGQSDHRWFNVPSSNGKVNYQFTNAKNIEPINFMGNFMWIRIVYYQMAPKEGVTNKIKRILLRR